jgi:hypothetical protein
MAFLDDLLGIHDLQHDGGEPVARRRTLNVVGACTLEDNLAQGYTQLTITPYTTNTVLDVELDAGQHDDLDPGEGFQSADMLQLQSGASVTLSGLVPSHMRVLLINVGDNDIVLLHASNDSLPDNRFLMANGTNRTIQLGQSCDLIYDPLTKRWRVLL